MALQLNFPSCSPTLPPLSCSSRITTLPLNFQSFTRSVPRLLSFRSNHLPYLKHVTATLSAVDNSTANTGTDGRDSEKKPLLEVKDLTAVIAESKQEILKGVNLVVHEGEVNANPNSLINWLLL